MRTYLMVALLIIGIIAVPALPRAHAASGAYFDNIVVVAMENQNYVDVMGTGTGSANAPFIASMLAAGATIPLYHGYGAAGRSIGGCSAGCYTALISGSDQGIVDGYSCCINAPTLMDKMTSAGLTWQAFCEDGCPRGNDHFPFTGFASIHTSTSIHGSTGPLDPEYVAALNSGSPSNFIWLTPTDGHNMHDNSIPTGDSYLHDLLVGSSGSLASPASGSVLASTLFAPGHRTLLMLWWDEYDPAPVLFYSPGIVKQGYVSSSNLYDEFSILHTIENNWGLSTLAASDAAAAPITEIFGTASQSGMTASFTVSPSNPVVNSPATFTASVVGGMGPYTVTWDFGDGQTATGVVVSHAFTGVQSYTVTETAQDSSTPAQGATSSQTVSDKAASGASGGGSGGSSGGGSSGGCLLCNTLPILSPSMWLLVIGGLLGMVGSLVLLTIRAQANLARTKRRVNQLRR